MTPDPPDVASDDDPPGSTLPTTDEVMGLLRDVIAPELGLDIVELGMAKGARIDPDGVVDMGRKNYLRIAGVIENMSVYVDDAGREHHLFGNGGGDRLAAEAGIPLLGRIPIEAAVADGGDHGRPIAMFEGPAAEAFRDIARRMIDEIIPPPDLAGCSARLMGAVDAALAAADAAAASN